MAEHKNYPLTILGMILFNVIVYLGITLVVMRPDPAARVTSLSLAHFSGVILASLVVPKILTSLAAIPEIPFTMEGMRKMWKLLVLLLPSVFLRLPGMNVCFGDNHLDLAYHFAIGLMVPLIYALFLKQVPFYQQGLWFGASVAIGLAAWQLFMLYPVNAVGTQAYHDRLLLVFQSQLIAVGLFVVVVLATVSKERSGFLRTNVRENAEFPNAAGECGKNMARMVVAAAIFFLMNGILDARLFPTLPRNYGSQFNWLFFIVMILVPLIGRYVDKYKEAGFRTAILICSIFFLLAPSITELSDIPFLYKTVHGLATVGQFTILMIIPIYLARLVPFGFWSCLIYCSVYMLRGVSVIGAWLIRNLGDVNDGMVILGSTLSAILFYILIGRVTFVGDGLATAAQANSGNGDMAGSAVGGNTSFVPTYENPSEFLDSRNLSPREREVATMLIKGSSTKEIATKLGISEHTVKAHVRNILTKFNVPSRKAFLAMFIGSNEI